MVTDEELLDSLRQKHGTENVGSIEEHARRRFVRLYKLPVNYAEAYDDAYGAGAYEQALTDHEAE
jgi:hypothetical protein